MKLFIRGGAYITAGGYGVLRSGPGPSPREEAVPLPPTREISPKTPDRFGRFDDYTRLGWSTIAMALADAGLADSEELKPLGIVISTRLGCWDTDLDFYRTTVDEGGAFASPNLFSYTLPNIVLGEAAAHFKLSGPTVCVGEMGALGNAALQTAFTILSHSNAQIMLTGWLDASIQRMDGVAVEEPFVNGSAFVVLDKLRHEGVQLVREQGRLLLGGDQQVSSILELFKHP